MLRRTGIKPGTSTLKRTGFKTPTASAGLLRVAAVQLEAKTKAVKPMKSRGMKGRAPTAAEQRFMDAMGKLPCVACAKDGIDNERISLHHIDGRVKPGAHFLVLPICAGHHQAGTGEDKTLVAIHPDKARFEARYGTQAELLAECVALINSGDGAGATAPTPEQNPYKEIYV